LNAVRYWLALSSLVGALALADQPPGPSSPPGQASPPSAPGRTAQDPAAAADATADDDFFEYLGADDVGDTDLWEMLKNEPPPGPRPQDSRQ